MYTPALTDDDTVKMILQILPDHETQGYTMTMLEWVCSDILDARYYWANRRALEIFDRPLLGPGPPRWQSETLPAPVYRKCARLGIARTQGIDVPQSYISPIVRPSGEVVRVVKTVVRVFERGGKTIYVTRVDDDAQKYALPDVMEVPEPEGVEMPIPAHRHVFIADVATMVNSGIFELFRHNGTPERDSKYSGKNRLTNAEIQHTVPGMSPATPKLIFDHEFVLVGGDVVYLGQNPGESYETPGRPGTWYHRCQWCGYGWGPVVSHRPKRCANQTKDKHGHMICNRPKWWKGAPPIQKRRQRDSMKKNR